ncbi:hypothetical protein Tco_0102638, partial [Tanacetum coccineum]
MRNSPKSHAKDTRNLRLGISADGVDVNTGNRHHSVSNFNYHIQLSSMVVYEKKVYQPFGVDTYDASIKDNFNLRAVVLWTINDYPTLGDDTYDASTKDNFNLRAIVLWTINDYPAL